MMPSKTEEKYPLPKEYTAGMDIYKAATFGQENSLVLSCLQMIEDNRTLKVRGTKPGSSPEDQIFSRPVGTGLEADILTYLPAKFDYDIRTYLNGESYAGRTLRTLLFPDSKQNEVFTLTMIKTAFQNFRLRLYNRMNGTLNDQEFNPKFSPVTFGWEDALILNCLQYVKESNNKIIGSIMFSKHLGCFTPSTGSEFEADDMTYTLSREPYVILDCMVNTTDEAGTLLKGLLFPERPVTTNKAYITKMKHHIMQLRKRMYNRPRMVAFMAVKHKRLGVASNVKVLSDDLLHMILQFI